MTELEDEMPTRSMDVRFHRLLVVVTGLPGTGKSTIADAVGWRLGAPVLGHDWAMSGLRPFPVIQRALDEMDPPGHRPVGWSILLALARAQLRRNGSVVLDGVARTAEIERCRTAAEHEHGRVVVIVTDCNDVATHRSRIEARQRCIPHWYEPDWDHVQRARDSWAPIADADLTVSATEPLSGNIDKVQQFVDHITRVQGDS